MDKTDLDVQKTDSPLIKIYIGFVGFIFYLMDGRQGGHPRGVGQNISHIGRHRLHPAEHCSLCRRRLYDAIL